MALTERPASFRKARAPCDLSPALSHRSWIKPLMFVPMKTCPCRRLRPAESEAKNLHELGVKNRDVRIMPFVDVQRGVEHLVFNGDLDKVGRPNLV
jgi:hypothetical protein